VLQASVKGVLALWLQQHVNICVGCHVSTLWFSTLFWNISSSTVCVCFVPVGSTHFGCFSGLLGLSSRICSYPPTIIVPRSSTPYRFVISNYDSWSGGLTDASVQICTWLVMSRRTHGLVLVPWTMFIAAVYPANWRGQEAGTERRMGDLGPQCSELRKRNSHNVYCPLPALLFLGSCCKWTRVTVFLYESYLPMQQTARYRSCWDHECLLILWDQSIFLRNDYVVAVRSSSGRLDQGHKCVCDRLLCSTYYVHLMWSEPSSCSFFLSYSTTLRLTIRTYTHSLWIHVRNLPLWAPPKDRVPADLEILEVTNGVSSSTETSLAT
jgi:hypothetical protein